MTLVEMNDLWDTHLYTPPSSELSIKWEEEKYWTRRKFPASEPIASTENVGRREDAEEPSSTYQPP
jgi:hypothetical protein